MLVTLRVSGRRAERDSYLRREDEYRNATRKAVADVLTAATMYARVGWTLSDPLHVIGLGYQGASKLRDATDDAMRVLTQVLVTARLLTLDAGLATHLDEVAKCLGETASVVHEAMDSLSAGTGSNCYLG